ncbi:MULTISPECIES: MFS transporter [Comamonas]|uniref:MFS transporter n=1 Tax=Comamonas TaxID=283 RepID=UPI0007C59703|nr:MFS transporter [Comamonas thiooxydans]MCO8248880.1 MFS transporter [Comamonas thiooxydans]OAD84689.1 MFS transporter [Comamonas thiooxydans]
MKLFRGWTIVAAAHGLLALAFGAAYSFGAFFKSIQTQFDAGRFSVGSLFAVTALLYYCVGAVAGPLADRMGLRRVTGAGVLLLATGFALASQTRSLAQLFAVFGLFVGCGVGLIYVPALVAVQRWFIRLRSRASGLASAGTGVGTFVAPLFAGWLLEQQNWQIAMQWFALAILLLGLPAALSMVGQPSQLGLNCDGDPHPAQAAAQAQGMELPQALRSSSFWWLFLAILLASVSLFAALVHITPMAQGLEIDASSSQLLIALIGAGNVLGRPLLGGLGDRLGALRLLMGLSIFLALLHLLWWQSHGWAALAVFSLLFGAAHGGCIALFPVLAAHWFGTLRLGAILGILYISVGLAAVVGASASGWVFDQTGDYTLAIQVSAALALLAVAALALAARGQRLVSSPSGISK